MMGLFWGFREIMGMMPRFIQHFETGSKPLWNIHLVGGLVAILAYFPINIKGCFHHPNWLIFFRGVAKNHQPGNTPKIPFRRSIPIAAMAARLKGWREHLTGLRLRQRCQGHQRGCYVVLGTRGGGPAWLFISSSYGKWMKTVHR